MEGLKYSAEAQTLINAGTASGGTMEYKLDDGEWSTALPQATNIGNYTVYYRIIGDDSHLDNTGSSVAVSISAQTVFNDTDEHIEAMLSAILNETQDVTINRTLYKDGAVNTLCLPFNVPDVTTSPFAGCTLYAFEDAYKREGALELTVYETTAIEAGKPYLISWPAGENITTMTFTGVEVAAHEGSVVGEGSVQFVGSMGRTQLPANENYLFVGENNTLYWSNNADASMKGFRAYFKVTSEEVAAHHAPALLVIRRTPTDIELVESGETRVESVQKVMRAGQLVIIRGDIEYNAQGQIVK